MVLLIDNYDSFSYNLFQYIGAATDEIKVIKNDEMPVREIEMLSPSHIIISPGPGRPQDAGTCEEIVEFFTGHIPILGVCLGHQAICETLGATITYSHELMHGKQCDIHIANGCTIFKGMPPLIKAARYHSLAVNRGTLPDELLVIAEDDGGEVMGVKHSEYEIYGLQFHPESIMTPGGEIIINNFLKIGGAVK